MLKLITWNIQSARTRDGGADWGLVVEALHGFADFDILCLQEVSSGFPARDGSDGGDGFAALAARLPGYHAHAAEPPRWHWTCAPRTAGAGGSAA
jgi:endonuclease/exonuclease/phosphatase family metal-dependent hydrolase